MSFEVRPAVVFEDVRQVIGPKRPDANVCWCLSYRIPSKQNKELRGSSGTGLEQVPHVQSVAKLPARRMPKSAGPRLRTSK